MKNEEREWDLHIFFSFCDSFASYSMTNPDDPQFCVISKGGYLAGLGLLSQKRWPPKRQAVLP